ncbi:MAG: hypothetical protein AMXMBFR13_31390, partial [Phycisphaerae bacterium]
VGDHDCVGQGRPRHRRGQPLLARGRGPRAHAPGGRAGADGLPRPRGGGHRVMVRRCATALRTVRSQTQRARVGALPTRQWHTAGASSGHSRACRRAGHRSVRHPLRLASGVVSRCAAARHHVGESRHPPGVPLWPVLGLVGEAPRFDPGRRDGFVHLLYLRIPGSDRHRNVLPRAELGLLLVAGGVAGALIPDDEWRNPNDGRNPKHEVRMTKPE